MANKDKDTLRGELPGALTFGVQGKSAYEVARENGFVGTVVEWLKSLIGPAGVGITALYDGGISTDRKYHELVVALSDGTEHRFPYRDGEDGPAGRDGSAIYFWDTSVSETVTDEEGNLWHRDGVSLPNDLPLKTGDLLLTDKGDVHRVVQSDYIMGFATEFLLCVCVTGKGGYYTPAVTQPDAGTMRVAFTPSKEGMPAVEDQTVELPTGTDGKSAYDYARDGGYTGTEEEFAAKLAATNSETETILSDNLLDKSLLTEGQVFYYGSSGYQLAASTYSLYGFIPLRGAGTYRTKFQKSVHSSTGTRIALVDDDGTWVANATGTAGEASVDGNWVDFEFVVTEAHISAGATKVAFDVYSLYLDTTMLVKDREYPDKYIPYGYIEVSTDSGRKLDNILNEKTAVFLGDSLCAGTTVGTDSPYYGYGWGGIIGEANRMTWKNYGKNGGTITHRGSDNTCIAKIADTAIAEYPAADYVIFEGGCNDADQMKEAGLGEISTDYANFDTSTFSGALEALILKLITAYPYARIGYIIPQKMYTGYADYTADKHIHRKYFDRAAEICRKWGIPYVDIWNGSPLNPKLSTASLFYVEENGQHLTEAGYLAITPMIESWMRDMQSGGAGNAESGEDGFSPIATVTQTDTGAVISIIDKDGTTTATITNGKDGTDGNTPVKFVDYYTDADKAELEAYIATELAKRNQVQLLFAESIEWLKSNGDKTKLYVLNDKTDPNYGLFYAWKLTEKEVETGGGYTNVLDGTTKHINQRWSRSSKAYTAANGYMATDLIPVAKDQIVYVNLPRVAFLSNYARIHYLDADKNYCGTKDSTAAVCHIIETDANGMSSFVAGYELSTNSDTSTNAAVTNADNITHMMLVFNMYDVAQGNTAASSTLQAITESDCANIIVSVGNPIVEGGGTEIVEEYAWSSTGYAFVPADYEPRIVELEKKTTNHTARIVALEKGIGNGSADETEAAALSRIQKWDKPVYDSAPVTLIDNSRVKPALTTSDRTIDAIYAKYRALMAAHPDYITETNMGKSSASDTFTAVDMLRFDFCEPGGLTQPDLADSARHETKPTLIFMSGIHTEWVGVWGLYYALEEITTNPDFDDVRRNAHIIVIPCSNPACLAWTTSVDGWRMSHVNANGVAIHNNFGVNHSTSGAVGEYNYGGSAPYSEPETQYIDAVMVEYPDAVAFVSCHNNDYSTYYGSHVIWASSATYHMCNMAFRLVDKMTKAWLDKYGQTLKDSIDEYKINMDANDYRLGRATMSSSKGTEQLNATKYGIMGVNLEISRMMKVFSGNTDGTSEVMTHGAEVYANFMRTLLWSYDHKDKKEYAPNLPWSE